MSHDWRIYAAHILDAIEKIKRIERRGDLSEDEVLYDASLRNLQTLSEATQRLPDSLNQVYSEIPWQQISGFRILLVHNYLRDLDPLTVLRVIQNHLPPLEAVIRGMLTASNKAT